MKAAHDPKTRGGHASAGGLGHLTLRQRLSKRWIYRNHRAFARLLYRFRRRVTPAGWVAVVTTVIVGAIGADTNASLGYETFSLLGCVLVLSICCTPFGRPRLAVERSLPRFGSVGQRLSYRLTLRNASSRSQTALRLFEDLPDPRPSLKEFVLTPEPGEEKRNWLDRRYGYYRWRWLIRRNTRAQVEEISLPDLPPDEDVTIQSSLAPLRRGPLRLEGVTIACPDPFGFFRSLRSLPLPQTILVLPKRHPVPQFQLPGSVKYQQGGVSMASSVGESEEFVSLREYRPGDPLRRLHWKSFAKLGKPIIKEFQDEFFVRHALLLDTFGAPAAAELFEDAVSVGASLAWAIQDQESLLDLMFVGAEAYCFTTGRGVGRVEKMMEILGSVQLSADKEFTDLEQLVLEHSVDISGCVCVFLEWDALRQRLVRSLLARQIPVRVFVVAPAGETLPPEVMADQPENFHVLHRGRIAEGLAQL
jgi:uncharacterized protein (DUF58 family)